MATIAWFTLLEAIRSRFVLLVTVGVIGLFCLTEFVGEISITETRQVQAAILAALLRFFSIAVIGLFVIASALREMNDKGFELVLSLPLPRYAYLFGKLIGYVALSLLTTILISLPLFLYAPAAQVGTWLVSLLCEQALIVSLALVCALTFSNVTVAFISVMACYLLSRSMETIRLLSADPVLETGVLSQDFMFAVVNIITLALPDLSRFTRSDWLTHGVAMADLQPVFIQTLIYLVLLCSAGLFDLYRKNI